MQIQAIGTQNNQQNFCAKIGLRKNGVLNQKNLEALEFVVRNRRGYQSDLQKFNIEEINSMKSVGFINTGHTLKSETYSVTKLGDQYYKDLFGKTSYYIQRAKGFINKIFSN